MIDQEKILGHREPYNGMGEAVGLLHPMQTSRDQEENKLQIKEESVQKPRNRIKVKDQGVRKQYRH